MYKIKDLQTDRYFADGEIFKSKKEACEQLISYHEIDCNMLAEKELLNKGKIDDCWNELSYFEWELEKVKIIKI
jgi:hypothetical protein